MEQILKDFKCLIWVYPIETQENEKRREIWSKSVHDQ